MDMRFINQVNFGKSRNKITNAKKQIPNKFHVSITEISNDIQDSALLRFRMLTSSDWSLNFWRLIGACYLLFIS